MLKKDEQYKIIDDYLSIEEYKNCWDYVLNAPYKAGEKDHHNSNPVGMVHELGVDLDSLFRLFPRTINNEPLSRAYINYYSPSELSSFHIDHDSPDAVTLLYYPCPTYHLDEGGATELIIDDEILGVRSIANRLLAFKSNTTHRATPFKTYQRWTVALKYTTYPDTGI